MKILHVIGKAQPNVVERGLPARVISTLHCLCQGDLDETDHWVVTKYNPACSVHELEAA